MGDPPLECLVAQSALVARLYRGSSAARWAVPLEDFRAALDASAAHAFAGRAPSDADVARHLTSLHLDDLALALACAAGHDAAWDHFIREHRPALYRAADAIDRTGGARELADSLYADLFGLRERDGARQSLFRYFHGRSSLATWTRAVLAQRHIDRARATRRLDPLPDGDTPGELVAPGSRGDAPDPQQSERAAAVRAALTRATAALEPRDRLRLGLYYAQNIKLAAIGRMLHEHEGTVSRHLTRTRGLIRDAVERILRDEDHLSDAAIEESIRSVVDDTGVLDLAEMTGALPDGKNGRHNRSTE